ncbi:MAG: hypothetical protein RBR62_07075 [Bacteroidales bacterium]|jgi:hypothetical protein|nr:hypothetical protein [Bacteroidales bacterium]
MTKNDHLMGHFSTYDLFTHDLIDMNFTEFVEGERSLKHDQFVRVYVDHKIKQCYAILRSYPHNFVEFLYGDDRIDYDSFMEEVTNG